MSQTAAPLVLSGEDRAELSRWSQGELPWLAERARSAAKHLGVSTSVIYELVNRDEMAHFTIGSRRYINRDQVSASSKRTLIPGPTRTIS